MLALGGAGRAVSARADDPPPTTHANDDVTPTAPLRHAWVRARARAASPRLRALAASVDAAHARVGAAAPLEDPMVMLRVWDMPAGVVTGMPGQTMLMAQQSVPLSSIRARREDVARTEAREAEIARDAAAHGALLEADLAYVALWEAVARTRLVAADAQLVTRRTALVRTLVASGNVSATELARSEALAARAESSLRTAETAVAAQRIALAALLDLPPDTPLPDPPEALYAPEAPTLAALTQDALSRRAETRYGEIARARAAALEGVARASEGPVLTVGAGAMLMAHEGLGWMVETGLTLPVWRDARRARHAEAAALAREAEAAEDAWRIAIVREVSRAWSDWHAANERLATLRARVLPAHENQLAVARAALETGGDARALVDAERELLGVRMEIVDAQAALLRAACVAIHAAGRDAELVEEVLQ
jgi:cobalt-zinc-cadmium efflux system outer membrane protein